MNEVKRIHLGRQPYVISVEAQKDLKAYLADIGVNVDDKDVVDEVELRMAELLTERGISGDKVVLPEDVRYLKEQLGSPEDFSDDDETPPVAKAEGKGAKRLFRDTDGALIAGVAAGLARYSGLDVVLIRLIFVLLAIFGGGIGIVLYILFWLVVPPAATASEKLQMEGRPVTLEALKASVGRADVAGSAWRMQGAVLPVINGLFRLALKLLGIGLMLAGVALLVGAAITKMYMVLHGGQLFQENIFPVGAREDWLLTLVLVLAVILACFLVLTGIATFKRKWPVRGWVTGVLAGVFLLCSAASLALAADAAPRVHARYEASLHTTAVKDIQPFDRVISSGSVDLVYISSPNYAVNVHYSGHPDLSKLKIYVSGGTLHVDSRALDTVNHCTMLCLFPRYNMTVQIYAPNIADFVTPPRTDIFYPTPPSLP